MLYVPSLLFTQETVCQSGDVGARGAQPITVEVVVLGVQVVLTKLGPDGGFTGTQVWTGVGPVVNSVVQLVCTLVEASVPGVHVAMGTGAAAVPI